MNKTEKDNYFKNILLLPHWQIKTYAGVKEYKTVIQRHLALNDQTRLQPSSINLPRGP